MLFDIRRLAWDPELCDLLGVDPARLPEPLPSAHVYGTTGEFGGEVPVAGIAGDQQAALFGQACHQPGPGEEHLRHRQLRPPQHRRAGAAPARRAARHGRLGARRGGRLRAGGLDLRHRRRRAVAARRARRSSTAAAETEALAASLDSNDGVYFVPALTGLGSPHWDPYARGTIVGLTRGSARAHLARAALEAIAFQTVDAVRAQEAACGERLEVLKADGGAVANRWLMQFQADVLGAPVVVPEIAETTALGAAYLAGIATGLWSREQVGEMWREAARYEPRMSADERESLLSQWRRALERSRGWARPEKS